MQRMQRRHDLAVMLAMAFLIICHGVTQGAEAQSVKDIQTAAEAGSTRAAFEMGAMYNSGRGVPKDTKEAVKWLKKAAKKGDPDAQFYLGVMYQKGRGVSKKDLKEALKWYQDAAEQGHVDAQFTLSNLHSQGIGVPKSKKDAKRWYDKAVNTWENERPIEPFSRHD